MVTIILPGYSPTNKKWLEETANEIPGSSEVRPIYWGHWTDKTIKFEPKIKASLLDGVSGKRVIDIVAKSIGTLVASYLIQKSPEKIRKIILCGIPLNNLSEEERVTIKNSLRLVPLKNILVIQNEDDPHGGYDTVVSFLSEFGDDIKVVSKPRDDHEYFFQTDFNKFLLG